MVLDRRVLAFDDAGTVEAFAECGTVACGVVRRPAADECDHWQARLLCTRRDRPRRRCAAQKRDEIAASDVHSITSSAVACRIAGMVRPSAFAVLRFTAMSNFVGN